MIDTDATDVCVGTHRGCRGCVVCGGHTGDAADVMGGGYIWEAACRFEGRFEMGDAADVCVCVWATQAMLRMREGGQ